MCLPNTVAVLLSELYQSYRPRGYTSPKGKKFQEIYSKFRSKCARGIWTLVLLMFLRVSYNPWLITDCTTVTDDGLVSKISFGRCVNTFCRVGTGMEMCSVLMITSIFFFSYLE